MKQHSNFILCLHVRCFVVGYLLPTPGVRRIIKAPLPSHNQIILRKCPLERIQELLLRVTSGCDTNTQK
jgi:hypothetical protein